MLTTLALIAAMQASAPAFCSRYVLPADDAQRATYATAVQKAANKPTPTASIEAVLGSPGWRVVWALPDDSEHGVFIFRQQPGDALRFVDVWGGSLGPDGPEVVVSWLRKAAHMPLPLARCVAERVAREGA